MNRFYIKYLPGRRGTHGKEFLHEFMRKEYPNDTFVDVINDGVTHYGYIEGSGDSLSRCLWDIQGRFSLFKLSESEFVGFAYTSYNPDDPEAMSFIDWIAQYGFEVDDSQILAGVKNMKRALFKEIVKRRFNADNDNISDLAKIVTLMNVYTDEDLTTEQITRRDNALAAVRSIYSEEMCVSAIEELSNNLTTSMTDYYMSVNSVENASTVEEVMAIEL